MPEFILQAYKHPVGKPSPKTIFTQNEYCPEVKMPEWDRLKECFPKDNDPYNPPGGNNMLSTYNRIGHAKEINHFDTIYAISCRQVLNVPYRKADKRPMIHYLTQKEKCQPPKERFCPISEDCAYNYRSTMHDSYKSYVDNVMKPLYAPKLPFMRYRRVRWEEPYKDECKFFDDRTISLIKSIQKIKGPKETTYNPITHRYRDGSTKTKREGPCVPLPYNYCE